MQRTTRPIITILPLVISLLFTTCVWARPTTPEQAKNVVQNWLGKEPRPMGAPLGEQIKEIQIFTDSSGSPTYYVIYLNPSGLVFLPADDLVEPLIAFVSRATSYDPSPANPMGALVSRDIPGRVLMAREIETQAQATKTTLAPETPWAASRRKWAWLEGAAKAPAQGTTNYLPSISDVWVAPLIKTQWGQGWAPPSAVVGYNYYTPNHYPCGCVATAMAQLMRYWQYPASPGIGESFYISVDGVGQYATVRGGDGAGGPYNWTNMPLDGGATDVQMQAIGALTYDAGVAANMNYTHSASYTGINNAVSALRFTFKYCNARRGYNYGSDISPTSRNAMVNPNLNANSPVLFGIKSSGGGGHAVVCDGYGLNASTMYHHINMGYEGRGDVWYNLPDVGLYTRITDCAYNVFLTGSGVIIGGRVTDSRGQPISGAMVTATAGGLTYSALAPTAGSGVFAIPYVPERTTFAVRVTKTGFTFAPQSVNTGNDYYDDPTTGNVWGVNFTATGTSKNLSFLWPLLLD
jgi:hypothetical protein